MGKSRLARTAGLDQYLCPFAVGKKVGVRRKHFFAAKQLDAVNGNARAPFVEGAVLAQAIRDLGHGSSFPWFLQKIVHGNARGVGDAYQRIQIGAVHAALNVADGVF